MGFLESYGNNIILAFLAGFLPPLIWLWFWLKKDPHPEPRSILILTFLGGMLSVLIAFVLEYAVNIFKESFSIKETVSAAAITLFLWAIIEETVKYLSARLTALKRISFDEPVDAIIYMVTAALGFAALENVLFLFNVCGEFGINSGFITGNLRFIGATLLHTASSALVGASIAFAFFHKEKMHRNIIGGIFLATILHFLFNFFIMRIEKIDAMLKIFIPLWIIIIIIFFVFEKVKKINKI